MFCSYSFHMETNGFCSSVGTLFKLGIVKSIAFVPCQVVYNKINNKLNVGNEMYGL